MSRFSSVWSESTLSTVSSTGSLTFLLGPSVNIWTQTSTIAEVEVARDGVLIEPPGSRHAFLFILVYLLVMGAATFWLFQRRGVTGARGS